MKKLFREGVLFEKSEIWAEGFENWEHFSSIAQFRWTICCTYSKKSNASTMESELIPTELYSLTEMCVVVLDILIQICSLFPSRFVAFAYICHKFLQIPK